MSVKKEKKEQYNYKLLSFILGAILLVGILSVGFIFVKEDIRTQGIIAGQENAVKLILQSLQDEGQVTIQTPQGNVTLVQKEYIELAQQNVIEYIYNTVNEQGSIVIETNESSIVLVPQ